MVRNLDCPKCKSNRTAYLGNKLFECLDCKFKFVKKENGNSKNK
jgi:ribosomal protein L37AE/L43A